MLRVISPRLGTTVCTVTERRRCLAGPQPGGPQPQAPRAPRREASEAEGWQRSSRNPRAEPDDPRKRRSRPSLLALSALVLRKRSKLRHFERFGSSIRLGCALDFGSDSLAFIEFDALLHGLLPAAAPRRVIRVQGRRTPMRRSLDQREHRRQHQQCRHRGQCQSADHRPAKRGRLFSTLAQTQRHRHHARDHRQAGHEDGPQAAACPFHGGVRRRK